MPEEPKFTVTLTPQQMDFIGKLTVTTLNTASAEARMANEVYRLLQGAVQAVQTPGGQAVQAPKSNGLQAVPSVPEVEVDVSPRSPIP